MLNHIKVEKWRIMSNSRVAILIILVFMVGTYSCSENPPNQYEHDFGEVAVTKTNSLAPQNSSQTVTIDGFEIPVSSPLPNLKPGWLWETDGPIIISNQPDTLLDEIPVVGSKVFLDIVVFNGTLIPIESGFNVDIFFDDEKIYSIKFEGSTPATGFRTSMDIMSELIASLNVTPGEHVLSLQIDPENFIEEVDESDNFFEKKITWSATEVQQTTTKYTNDDLDTILSTVPRLIQANPIVLGEDQGIDIQDVIDIADAGIFLLTGASVLDQRIRIQILDRQDYLYRLESTFNDLFALNDGTDFLALAQERDFQKKYSLGKKDRLEGMVDVMVDGSNRFDVVISTLVHELAHALQDIIAPWQTEGRDPNNSLELMAVREAQAQQFERAFWLVVNDVSGGNLLRFRHTKARDVYINSNASFDSTVGYYQHDLGRAIQWLAVLSDGNLKPLKIELLENGELSYESGFRLFEYLLTLKSEEVQEYVTGLLSTFDDHSDVIVAVQKQRLVDIDMPDFREYSALEDVGLLMP